jgi:hypothetical protein
MPSLGTITLGDASFRQEKQSFLVSSSTYPTLRWPATLGGNWVAFRAVGSLQSTASPNNRLEGGLERQTSLDLPEVPITLFLAPGWVSNVKGRLRQENTEAGRVVQGPAVTTVSAALGGKGQ